MNWNGKLGWFLRLGVGVLIAVIAFWQFQSQQEAEARREKLRLIASVTTASLVCRDERAPFEVTIRNLTGRTVLEASFILHELLAPVGIMPSDRPTASLKAPLPPGETQTSCEALNRYRLLGRGVDPHRVLFAPMLAHIEFQ